MSKIILVGANHAGTAAINTILDQYPQHELVVYDANDNISYLACGTALWVGNQITDPQGLFYSSKESMEQKGAQVFLETEVTQIDFQNKTLTARDKNTGKEWSDNYDKLILATGSLPIAPNLPGKDLKNVQFVKFYQDGASAIEALQDASVKDVAIIGAGYIGVELAEAIVRNGRKAHLFDVAETCLSTYYDSEFCGKMDHVLGEHGVACHFTQAVTELQGENGKVSAVVTDKGSYPAQLALMAIGFRPNNALGKDHLALFRNGAYQVNRKQETSIPDVYAIGDCASLYDNARQQENYIALATNAVRSGIVAAHNACGTPLESLGVQGSNGICIFDYKMVSTGMSVKAARAAGFDVQYTDYEDLQKPAFIKAQNHPVKIRIVYEKGSRRIVGAQMASYEDMSMGIHMFSLAIEEGVTIDKLKLLDIFFLPHFNQPYNYITMAALSAK